MAEIKHIDAFEYYYSLGSVRTYEQVAQKYNNGIRTVERWASNENWQDEVRSRDIEALKRSREKAIRAKTKKIENYSKINGAIVANIVEKIKKDKLDDKGIKAYLEVAKFDLILPDVEDLVYEKLQELEFGNAGAVVEQQEEVKDNKVIFEFV